MTLRIFRYDGGWAESNCYRCKKDAGIGQTPTCPIQYALDFALFGGGTVSEEIAQRMNLLEYKGHYGWPCGEVEWTEERQAQVAAKTEAAT